MLMNVRHLCKFASSKLPALTQRTAKIPSSYRYFSVSVLKSKNKYQRPKYKIVTVETEPDAKTSDKVDHPDAEEELSDDDKEEEEEEEERPKRKSKVAGKKKKSDQTDGN